MNEIERLADALWAFLTVAVGRYTRKAGHRPSGYVGRHRAPSVWQQWTTAVQAAAATDAQQARALTPAEWWELRRRDYAPAYARVQAQVYA